MGRPGVILADDGPVQRGPPHDRKSASRRQRTRASPKTIRPAARGSPRVSAGDFDAPPFLDEHRSRVKGRGGELTTAGQLRLAKPVRERTAGADSADEEAPDSGVVGTLAELTDSGAKVGCPLSRSALVRLRERRRRPHGRGTLRPTHDLLLWGYRGDEPESGRNAVGRLSAGEPRGGGEPAKVRKLLEPVAPGPRAESFTVRRMPGQACCRVAECG